MHTLDLMKQITIEAGEILLKYYGVDKIVQQKPDGPVTIADKESNEFIVSRLAEAFPNDAILAEESKVNLKRLKHNRVWCVDPLDGTLYYLAKSPEFSVMVGLVQQGRPVLGVVYEPLSRQLFYAKKGLGAFCQIMDNQPQRIRVSRTISLEKMNILVSRSRGEFAIRELLAKFPSASIIRRGGSVKACLVAAGEADAFFSPLRNAMGEWDLCAPEIILQEAGGKLTNLEGKELIYNQRVTDRYGILATNGRIHEKFLEQLKK